MGVVLILKWLSPFLGKESDSLFDDRLLHLIRSESICHQPDKDSDPNNKVCYFPFISGYYNWYFLAWLVCIGQTKG